LYSDFLLVFVSSGCVTFSILLVIHLSGWARGELQVIFILLFVGILLTTISMIFFIFTRNIYILPVGVFGIEILISGFIEVNYQKKKKRLKHLKKNFNLKKELEPVLSMNKKEKLNKKKSN
jgi:hypothetical protein